MGKYLTLASTLLVLISNLLANLIPYNGKTTAELSDAIPVFFTPAGYVFAIWGVIYIGLIAYTFFRFRYDTRIKNWRNIDIAFLKAAVANALWIVVWHYEQVTLSVLIMLVLLVCLIYLYIMLNKQMGKLDRQEFWLVKVPFGIYLSWISVATIANISAALFKLNWDGLGIQGHVWAAIMIVIALVLTELMLWFRRDLAYAAVYVWAVAGIAYKFNFIPTINTTVIISIVLVVLTALWLWRHDLMKSLTRR